MKLVNSETSLAASSASSTPVRTCAVVGRIGLMSSTSCSGVTPSAAATEIASNDPSRSRSCCAVGIVKTANVAVPSELTLPYCATPETRKSCTGFSVAILTESPTP